MYDYPVTRDDHDYYQKEKREEVRSTMKELYACVLNDRPMDRGDSDSTDTNLSH